MEAAVKTARGWTKAWGSLDPRMETSTVSERVLVSDKGG